MIKQDPIDMVATRIAIWVAMVADQPSGHETLIKAGITYSPRKEEEE